MKTIMNEYRIISLFTFISLFVFVQIVFGAPLIQGVTGDLVNRGTLTITGSAFATHDDFGGADGYLPYLWETFDDANPSPKLTKGYAKMVDVDNKENSSFCLKHQRHEPAETYTTFRGETVTMSTMYNCGTSVKGLSPRSQYFYSGWFMTRNINTLTDGDSNQLKTLDASPESNNNKIYFNLEGYAGYPRYSMAIESNTTMIDKSVLESSPDGTWHRFDTYVSVPVSANDYTDIVRFWIDGRLVGDSQQVGLLYKSLDDVQSIDGIYYVNWINNSSNSPFYILSDDAFVDFTQARVEISESAVWDDSVQLHKELQVPIFWNKNSIEIKINQGFMSTLSDKFLFIVDENGVVSNAFPLSSLSAGLKPRTVQGFQTN